MTIPNALLDRTSRTKIVATLGPSSSSPEIIEKLVLAGMNVARINASHGDHAGHAETIRAVRAAAESTGRTVGILLDLQGPKIRIGDFTHPPREVSQGDTLVLAVNREPEGDELPTDYAALDTDVEVGQRLLIDDGQLGAVVTDVQPGSVHCRALDEGVIRPRKGINLPDTMVSAPSLSERDRADARFAVEQGVDLIALSFVRQAADVEELREFLVAAGRDIPIVAKIEKPQALDNLESILRASWGVMVARGDLGVELSPEQVPMAQKRIIHTARRLLRPVITATQMLESMTRQPRPTRAEASDVANAVLDGSDAVMLSGETAVGRFPIESVEMMQRIIRSTRRFRSSDGGLARRRERNIDTKPDAVADAACTVAYHLRAHAIVAFTQSGMSAILAAARRPDTPILAFTNNEAVRNSLALVWGVDSFRLTDVEDTDTLVRNLDKTLIDRGLAKRGDRLVVLMGAPTMRMGPTNLMLVYEVKNYWEEQPEE